MGFILLELISVLVFEFELKTESASRIPVIWAFVRMEKQAEKPMRESATYYAARKMLEKLPLIRSPVVVLSASSLDLESN